MEYYRSSSSNTQYPLLDSPAVDHFIVDDLLDFSNDDLDHNAALPDSTTTTTAEQFTDLSISTSSSDSSFPHFSPSFLADFCEPHDQLQELQWLSNFEEEHFSNEDLQKLHLISGIKSSSSSPAAARPAVPSKARSKRSRVTPSSWSSRPVVISPEPQKKTGMEGRRCLHCGSDKTPQWRMGPMGPKTLCNACGVRFKSGRLVPEYRPATSPSFVVSEHSNSHRKVVELRRQKEMMTMMIQQQQQFLRHGDEMLIQQQCMDHYEQLI